MSRRNSSSRSACRSASSPKAEEKTLLFFSSCSMPRRGLSRSSWHLKPISIANDLHQVLKPKNNGTWDATNIAKRRVKHHPFHYCLSIFFTSDDDLQCTLYSTLCSERFQRKILRIVMESRYDTILYCAHDIMCRSATYRIMEQRLGPECTKVV